MKHGHEPSNDLSNGANRAHVGSRPGGGIRLTEFLLLLTFQRMSDIIYPRSPRETMCGWMHLPRYVDKIRLQLAGKLHPDYQPNLGKGFDERWLKAAGLTQEQFVSIVRDTFCDGEVCDWVLKNVQKSDADKRAHADSMLNYPRPDDADMQARLKMRKEQAGLAHRDDIKTFVDFIDVDEKRS
jgi:hypothetical protein